jgi:hypothetical protein
MIKAIVAAVAVLASAPALADEVIIHREAVPVEVAPAPAPDAVVIEKHVPDCHTTRTHTEDDTGSSTTVTRRDCD